MSNLLNPERWARVKDLCASLMELPSEHRSRWLAEHCLDDEVVRREVERILAHQSGAQIEELGADVAQLRQGAKQVSSGDLLAGRFRIERFLGEGGMGQVWQAADLELQRPVALKTLHPTLTANSRTVERFKREVMLASRITHPNICRIYDYGRQGELHFLTMEYLDGETLTAKLEREGRMSVEMALPIIGQLCQGLDAAHEQGIIHRDLKPGNIMLSSGRAVITDFGLARALLHEDKPNQTATGAVLGTPAYMAPEQVTGEPVTPGTDIYALGVVMYEMLTGRRPHEGGSAMSLLARKIRDRAPSPRSLMPELSQVWESVVLRCLEPAPNERYSRATRVAEALSAGRVLVWRERLRRSGRRLWRTRWGLAAAGLILLAGWAFGLRDRSVRPLTFQPTSAALRWYENGLVAFDTGSTFTASRLIEQALREDPRFPRAQAKLAELYESLDMLDRSKGAQIKLSALVPDLARLPPDERLELEAVRATVLRDYPAAAAKYEALAALTQGTPRRRAKLQAGRAWRAANDPKKARAVFEALRREDGRDAAVLLQIAGLDAQAGNQKAALPLFAETEALFRLAGNLNGVAEVRLQRAEFLLSRRNLEESRADVEVALQDIRRVDNPQQRVKAEMLRAAIVRRGGRPDEAAEMLRATLDYARAQGIEGIAAANLNDLGFGYLAQSQLNEAQMTFEQALQMSRRTNNVANEARAHGGLAQTFTRLDQLGLAQQHYTQAVTYFARASDQESLFALRVTLIDLAIGRGDHPLVLSLSEELRAQAQRSGSGLPEAQALGRMAHALLYLGELPRYREVQTRRVTLYRKLQQVSNVATNLISLAILDVKLGNPPEARRSLREAEPILSRLGDNQPRVRHRFWLAEGELALEEGRWQDAVAAAGHALQEEADVVASGGGAVEPQVSRCLAISYGRLPDPGRFCDALAKRASLPAQTPITAALARAGHLESLFARGQFSTVVAQGPAVFEMCFRHQPRLTAWRVSRMIQTAAARAGQSSVSTEWKQRSERIFTEMAAQWPASDRQRVLASQGARRIN